MSLIVITKGTNRYNNIFAMLMMPCSSLNETGALGRPLRASASAGIDRKHIHRSRLALERNEPEGLDRDALAERRSRRLVDQNGALRDLGVRLEPRRKIDRVTDARISRAF